MRCTSTPLTASPRSTTATCASTTTRRYFEEHDLAVPTTLDDLTDPAYADLLVVENPATSSPGLAFLLATVDAFGEDGWEDWWGALRDNGVQVVDGWEEAYYSSFSGGLASEGDRPLVVSYASSPPAEVVFADPPVDEAAHRGDRRQLLPPGRGGRHPRRHRAPRRGRPADRLPAVRARCRPTCRCRCSCSRRAAASSCPRSSWSTPPRRRTCSSCPPRRSTPTGRTGSTGGPTSCCGDPGAVVDRAPGGPARLPRLLLRLAGRQHRRRGPPRRPGVGPPRGGRGARRSASSDRWRGSRSGRRWSPPGSRCWSGSRPPTSSRPTSSAGAGSSKRCSWCPSCSRPWWWGRPSSRCSGPAACSASTCAAARWPSCWPTPSSTTPSWSAPSGACGRAWTRAPRRRHGSSERRAGRPSRA